VCAYGISPRLWASRSVRRSRIVSDLVEAGYVSRQREGRRNRYVLNLSVPMRHPSQVDHEIGELVDVLRLDDSSDSEAAG